MDELIEAQKTVQGLSEIHRTIVSAQRIARTIGPLEFDQQIKQYLLDDLHRIIGRMMQGSVDHTCRWQNSFPE